jgi:hypothetical protein
MVVLCFIFLFFFFFFYTPYERESCNSYHETGIKLISSLSVLLVAKFGVCSLYRRCKVSRELILEMTDHRISTRITKSGQTNDSQLLSSITEIVASKSSYSRRI